MSQSIELFPTGLRGPPPDDAVHLADVSGCALEFEVPGKPRGAQRPRVNRLPNGRVVTHMPHVEHEHAIRIAAEAAQGGPLGAWVRIETPVRVEIESWHRRPQSLMRRMDRGSGALPYRGKPDIDNIAALALNALTKAGTWHDDTQVADLVVRRRYLPLGLDGVERGIERTVVRVFTMGGA